MKTGKFNSSVDHQDDDPEESMAQTQAEGGLRDNSISSGDTDLLFYWDLQLSRWNLGNLLCPKPTYLNVCLIPKYPSSWH